MTLASLVAQARDAGAELIVINDGGDPATNSVARRHGCQVIQLDSPRGLNAGRNAGIAAARSDLIVLVDDDVEAPAGWLAAMLAGAHGAPEADVLGGPIHGRLEGGGPRSCGREGPPITTLDLGPVDRDTDLVWGANMAIRRRAVARVGHFDEALLGRGDEEEWERRYTAAGGVVRYVAAAGLDHRRTREDATVRILAGAAYGHGRAARRHDARRGAAPTLTAELRTLAGCCWHILRRRCAMGIVLVAHSAGRLRQATRSGDG